MSEVPIERHKLDNGLRIILSRISDVPVVTVNIGYDVGSRHEEQGRTGFAHLYEHMMFQGSANVAKGEHGRLIDAAGGRWNASTWVDHTNYHEAVPSHHLELAIWLEAERLANLLPAITQEKLDNQRDVVKNERRTNIDNQPYGSMEERLQRLVYPAGHPYHHSTNGSMDDLESATLEDISRFFAAHYAPNNAVLTVAGDFDPSEAMEMIGRHFGPIPPNPQIPRPPEMTVPATLGGEVREVVTDDVELPRVCLAYRIPPWGTPEFDAFEVSSDILATGRASRLYERLVREEGIAQDVAAAVFPFAFGATIFAAWVTARPDVSAEAIELALTEEIAALGDQGPTENALDRAQMLYQTSRANDLEEGVERAERLSMYAALWDEPERINTDVARYAAVDATRIGDAWRRFGTPDNRVVLTFLPAKD